MLAALLANTSSPRTEVVHQLVSDAQRNAYELPPAQFCAAVARRDEATHCAPPRRGAPPRTSDGRALVVGALMRVEGARRWKLLAGYPGWRHSWDGWLKPPSAEGAATAVEEEEAAAWGAAAEDPPGPLGDECPDPPFRCHP